MTATTASPTQAVLSVNAGSSSLKFAVYPVGPDGAGPAGLSGAADGLEPGGKPALTVQHPGRDRVRRAIAPREGESAFDAALGEVIAAVAESGGPGLAAVSHRVVHGGTRYSESVVVDDDVMGVLETFEPLAPLHQPHNLAGIRAFRRALPALPQVACFDTAFHTTVPPTEQRFALPESLFQAGIRRYGFHGLSYRYVSRKLPGVSPRAAGRLLIAHLGNGASLCAVEAGRSVGMTTGFSALEGLVMGTRTGSIDPGVLLHLLRQGWDLPRIEKLLYKESGLLGVSGVSADMRTLRASSDPGAARAIALFTHRIVRECGALTACLGGIDVLVFTGGIGEHDADLRRDVCAALAHLGVALDEQANAAAIGGPVRPLHAQHSAVEVWMVPTDEGRVAAGDALQLLGPGPA